MIFRKGHAKYIPKKITLHKFDGQDTETLSYTWMCDDIFKFENIAVMKKINNQMIGNGDFAYLSCADCEKGPVGIRYLSSPNKTSYIAHDRIRYNLSSSS